MWKWLTRLLVQPFEDDQQQPKIEEAQRARLDAERKLLDTELMGGEVKFLSAWARNIRTDNHFSQRIADAFGRIRDS